MQRLLLCAAAIVVAALGIIASWALWAFARWLMPPPWNFIQWLIFIVACGTQVFVFSLTSIYAVILAVTTPLAPKKTKQTDIETTRI